MIAQLLTHLCGFYNVSNKLYSNTNHTSNQPDSIHNKGKTVLLNIFYSRLWYTGNNRQHTHTYGPYTYILNSTVSFSKVQFNWLVKTLLYTIYRQTSSLFKNISSYTENKAHQISETNNNIYKSYRMHDHKYILEEFLVHTFFMIMQHLYNVLIIQRH